MKEECNVRLSHGIARQFFFLLLFAFAYRIICQLEYIASRVRFKPSLTAPGAVTPFSRRIPRNLAGGFLPRAGAELCETLLRTGLGRTFFSRSLMTRARL